MELFLTSLPGQFQEIHSPCKLCDHDVIPETWKILYLHKTQPRKKVLLCQKGDFESMRKDASDFAEDMYSVVTQIIARIRKTFT